jgi:hypothetical protein
VPALTQWLLALVGILAALVAKILLEEPFERFVL